ncbi:MAG: (d)CMP kinase [Deltaproteobacteria bacterium]|nr:(d)CMP kinase [Deltaproteobacteria bacterium]
MIAVDGPSGVGKSTVSKLVAKELGYQYVDTGAMYRAFAVGVKEAGIDIKSEEALNAFIDSVKIELTGNGEKVLLNGRDVSKVIREPWAGELTSKVSAISPVREFLVSLQREIGASSEGIVMEGRDIGTVVFPEAEVKIFLTASSEVRAKRRHKEFLGKETEGVGSVGSVEADLNARDERDTKRADSPLKAADDAVIIDTGELDIDGVVHKALDVVRKRKEREG